MTSEYEQIRLRNIEDNKRILAELGLVNPYKPLPRIIKRSNNYLKRKRDSFDIPSSKRVKIATSATPEETDFWTPGTRRRSRRLLGKDAPEIKDLEDVLKEEDAAEEDEADEEELGPKIPKDRPQVYGAIPGVEVGTHWMTRMEANRAGVHRPVVAGIHPGPKGAYSIALSGGYEDDLDYGECFTYTGEGGRDLKGTKANPKNLRTAPQSKHQTLSRGNQALVDSAVLGHPVRVLRGYKLDGPFAPEMGYRYDGLYKVDKWWYTQGLAGFSVYKFALSRLKDQPPPPWYMNTETGDVIMWSKNSVDADFRSEGDEEHNNMRKEKTEKKTNTDLLKENKNIGGDSISLDLVNHENKDTLKMVESASENGDQGMDETESEGSTHILCKRNSGHLLGNSGNSGHLLGNSVEDKSNKSSQTSLVICNNVLPDNSQDSGIAVSQHQAISDADQGSAELGDVLTTVPGKLDENKNVTLSRGSSVERDWQTSDF